MSGWLSIGAEAGPEDPGCRSAGGAFISTSHSQVSLYLEQDRVGMGGRSYRPIQELRGSSCHGDLGGQCEVGLAGSLDKTGRSYGRVEWTRKDEDLAAGV